MFLSGSLSRRIATIREAMETREVTSTGLLTRIAHSTPAGGDEIDGLVRSYNRMAHRIETLVDTVYRAELEASHHHLSALQSQINPHFLYNALDAIRCNVSLNERALAEEIIRSLSRLLRIALSGGREMISIARELELVSLYLKLNSAVYGARFAFAIDDAPWAGEYAIPKFVLQPLVENAISHGLDAVQTGGVVRVLALCDDRRIEIVVEDNGAGFTQSRLAEVTAALASHRGAGTSIGLPNVEQRIKLSFGNEYGLRISNGTEGGARVSVLIPKIAMKEQGE
jgi:two-component system sensor histidine kinase YesM